MTALESDRLRVQQPIAGIRAGAIMFIGIAGANAGNYLFHLVAARRLGPSVYADVASLVALSGLIALPLAGIQLVVGRYVASAAARGDTNAISEFARRSLIRTGIAGCLLTLVFLGMTNLIASVLGIGSTAAVILTAALTIPAFLSPVAFGVAQGLQRFPLLAAALGLPPLVRVAAAVALIGIGFGSAGAMGATLIATSVGLLVPIVALGLLTSRPHTTVRVRDREAWSLLVPTAVGLLAITSLSTVDVLIAKVVFDDTAAGIYGAASLIGRVILYLPAAIVTVLLPKVAARVASEQGTRHILGASLGVTLGFCSVMTLIYALVPDQLVHLALGSEFEDAAPLLWLFGVTMSGCALLSVLLTYHLGRGEGHMAWLLLFGAVAHIAAASVFHETPHQLIAVGAVIAALLLVAHEALYGTLFGRPAIRRAAGRRAPA